MDTIQEEIKRMEQEANQGILKTNTEIYPDLILKCTRCGFVGTVQYSDKTKEKYLQFKENKNPLCAECFKKASEKKEMFYRMSGSRIYARKNIDDVKIKNGIKKRFLCSSFQNYKGTEYVKEIINSNKNENIFLYGSPGTGKTHLACAYMAKKLWHNDKCVFVSTAELLMEIRATFKDSASVSESSMIEKYTDVDILILDDIGVEKITEWVLQTLYLIIDNRYAEQRQTVYTSNLSPKEIAEKLGDRMASRVCSGKIIKLSAPDYRLERRVR